MTDHAALNVPIPDLALRRLYLQALLEMPFIIDSLLPDDTTVAPAAVRLMRVTLQTGDWITTREHLGVELLRDTLPWLPPPDVEPDFYTPDENGEPHPTPLARLLAAHLRGVTSRVAGITEQQWTEFDARFDAAPIEGVTHA